MNKQNITIAEKRRATFMITVPYTNDNGDDRECKVVLHVDYSEENFSISNHQSDKFIFINSHDISKCKAVAKAIGQAIDIAEKELNG